MDTVLITTDESVATITINRPEAMNSLNYQVLQELARAVARLREDAGVKAVILTGAGEKAFVAGADVAAMSEMTPAEGYDFVRYGQEVFAAIETMPKPVIAAVNGYALGGGCELAMACDLRIAAETAKFGQPETNVGIIPGFGGTQRLPRLIGKGRALELIFTGEMITATEAERLGLVNKVVPAAELLPEARRMAAKIATKSPLILRLAKNAVNYGLNADLETACAYEASLLGLCFASEDKREGMAAFIAKRQPHFQGR